MKQTNNEPTIEDKNTKRQNMQRLINEYQKDTLSSQLNQTQLGKNYKETPKQKNTIGKLEKTNEDEIIYADDAKLFPPPESDHINTHRKLHNYNLFTKTRKLKINWEKVKLLTNKTKTHIKKLPPPYNEIEETKTATILGKQINIHNRNDPAVQQRIQLANRRGAN